MFSTTQAPAAKMVPQVHVFLHNHSIIGSLMAHVNEQIPDPKIVNMHVFCEEHATMMTMKDAMALASLMSSHKGFTVHDITGDTELKTAMRFCHEITRVMSTCNPVDAIIIDDSCVKTDGIFTQTPVARVTYTSSILTSAPETPNE